MPRLPEYDPPASVDDIGARFRQFSDTPLLVNGHSVQCDAQSLTAFQNAIDTWDIRPEVPGWFYMENGELFLRWKMADNTVSTFTKQQLTDLYAAILTAKAIRTQQLWAKAQWFKANNATLHGISTIDKWLN